MELVPPTTTGGSGGSWTDFLNTIVNATTRIITTAKTPGGVTVPVQTYSPTDTAGALGSSSMLGLVVVVLIVIVVMKA